MVENQKAADALGLTADCPPAGWFGSIWGKKMDPKVGLGARMPNQIVIKASFCSRIKPAIVYSPFTTSSNLLEVLLTLWFTDYLAVFAITGY